ncbi:MAG TPA: hypothetical protein IAB85_05870 [Candidatus Coprenecus merdigallinarum]|nr:hypothetical protein [Candidatus Coprenecus merdigallinarum]
MSEDTSDVERCLPVLGIRGESPVIIQIVIQEDVPVYGKALSEFVEQLETYQRQCLFHENQSFCS